MDGIMHLRVHNFYLKIDYKKFRLVRRRFLRGARFAFLF